MIIKQKRYHAGGAMSNLYKKSVDEKAPWFNCTCLRLVDSIVTFLPFIAKQDEKTANDVVDYILEKFNAYNLPNAPEEWENTPIEPLRLYYHIMQAADLYKNSANYLLDKIKIDGKHFYIEETHGQGDNQ